MSGHRPWNDIGNGFDDKYGIHYNDRKPEVKSRNNRPNYEDDARRSTVSRRQKTSRGIMDREEWNKAPEMLIEMFFSFGARSDEFCICTDDEYQEYCDRLRDGGEWCASVSADMEIANLDVSVGDLKDWHKFCRNLAGLFEEIEDIGEYSNSGTKVWKKWLKNAQQSTEQEVYNFVNVSGASAIGKLTHF